MNILYFVSDAVAVSIIWLLSLVRPAGRSFSRRWSDPLSFPGCHREERRLRDVAISRQSGLFSVRHGIATSAMPPPRDDVLLFRLEIQIADDLAPARVLLLEESRVLLRRVGHDLETHLEKLLSAPRAARRPAGFRCSSRLTISRGMPAGPRMPNHVSTSKPSSPDSSQRRELRRHRRALEARHGEPAHFSAARVRQQRADARVEELHVTAENVDDRRAVALVVDRHHVDLRHALDELHRHVGDEPMPPVAKLICPGRACGERDEILERLHRHRRMHDHEQRVVRDTHDRHEIPDRVVADLRRTSPARRHAWSGSRDRACSRRAALSRRARRR